MKKWLWLVLAVFLVSGCIGGQIQDTAHHQALGYASGKAVGISVNKFVPKADPKLRQSWSEMMDANKEVEIIPDYAVAQFYNQCILILTEEYKKDPYGLIQDLAVLLSIYGASFTEDGQLLGIKPVPKTVMEYFAMGYRNGADRVKSFGDRAEMESWEVQLCSGS